MAALAHPVRLLLVQEVGDLLGFAGDMLLAALLDAGELELPRGDAPDGTIDPWSARSLRGRWRRCWR